MKRDRIAVDTDIGDAPPGLDQTGAQLECFGNANRFHRHIHGRSLRQFHHPHALKVAHTFNAPALSANPGFNGLGPQFFPQNQSFTVSAALRFDPLDGGLTAGFTKVASGNLATAQAQLASQQIAVVSEVSQAYLDVRSSEQRVAAARTQVIKA
jgi:outer membrane efflux protein